MAAIRDFKISEDITDVTYHYAKLPYYEVDDILIWFVCKDSTNGGAFNTPSGWTSHPCNSSFTTNGGFLAVVYYKIVTATGIETPFTYNTDPDGYASICMSIKGANTSDPFYHYTVYEANTNAEYMYPSGSYPSVDEDTLLLHLVGSGNAPWFPKPSASAPIFLGTSVGGSVAASLAYWYAVDAEVTKTELTAWCASSTTTAKYAVITINDAGNSIRPPFTDEWYAPGHQPFSFVDPSMDFCTETDPATTHFQYHGINCYLPDVIYKYDNATYYDSTSFLEYVQNTSQIAFPVDVDDCIYIGHSTTFDSVHIYFYTGSYATVGTCAWEYWNGSSWSTLDLYANMQSDVKNLISGDIRGPASFYWDGGIPGDWATTTVNSTSKYWVRIRVTGAYTGSTVFSWVRINGRPFRPHVAGAASDFFEVNFPASQAISDVRADQYPASFINMTEYALDNSYNMSVYNSILFQFYIPQGYTDMYCEYSDDIENTSESYVSRGGIFVGFSDTSGNSRLWQVASRDSIIPNIYTDGIFPVLIDPSHSFTACYEVGTLDVSAIKYVHVGFVSRPSGSAASLYFQGGYVSYRTCLLGGYTTNKLTISDIPKNLKNSIFTLAEIDKNIVTFWIENPYTDGVHNTQDAYYDFTNGVFQFPPVFNEEKLYLNMHVPFFTLNMVGVNNTYSNLLVTSESKYLVYLQNSLSSKNSGIMVNASIEQNFNDKAGWTFINCYKLEMTWSDGYKLNVVSWADPDLNNILVINQNDSEFLCTRISYSTFDVTTLDAGIYMCTIDNITVNTPDTFKYCTFNGSSSGGHAIRITYPGTYSLIGNIFNNFGADGTTSAAIFNDSGGAVTINISSGGNTPTYRNGTGATTVINNGVTIHVHCINESGSNVENARIRLVKTTGGAVVLEGLTNASGYLETTYNYSGDEGVEGWARKSTSSPLYKQADIVGTITSNGFDTTVIMVLDE